MSSSHSHSGSYSREMRSFNVAENSANNVSIVSHHKTKSRFSNSIEFFLSALGFAVGFGNIWRFPYMLYRNGGGVFFIPYLVCIAIIVLPTMLLETLHGQLYRYEVSKFYDFVHPRLFSLSVAINCIIFFISVYYMGLVAWCFTFLMYSFQTPLPWTPNGGMTVAESIVSEGYFINTFLKRSEGLFDMSGYRPDVAIAFLVMIVVVFIIIFKGIDTSKYSVYIVVPLPYILLTIMFIKGLTLPGNYIGWAFLFKSDWSQLFTLRIWVDAASQTIFSAGLAHGIMIKFASHRAEDEEVLKSSIRIPIMNFLTSIFAAVALFAFVGYASHETGIPIEDMPVGGMELIFVVYPALLTTLPFPQIWSILFFTMLTCIGLCTEYILVETVSKMIYSTLRRLGKDISPTMVTFML